LVVASEIGYACYSLFRSGSTSLRFPPNPSGLSLLKYPARSTNSFFWKHFVAHGPSYSCKVILFEIPLREFRSLRPRVFPSLTAPNPDLQLSRPHTLFQSYHTLGHASSVARLCQIAFLSPERSLTFGFVPAYSSPIQTVSTTGCPDIPFLVNLPSCAPCYPRCTTRKGARRSPCPKARLASHPPPPPPNQTPPTSGCTMRLQDEQSHFRLALLKNPSPGDHFFVLPLATAQARPRLFPTPDDVPSPPPLCFLHLRRRLTGTVSYDVFKALQDLGLPPLLCRRRAFDSSEPPRHKTSRSHNQGSFVRNVLRPKSNSSEFLLPR